MTSHSSDLPSFRSSSPTPIQPSTLPPPQSRPRPLGREEQAKLEIGITEITRAQKWVLTLAFLAVIFAVPAMQQIHEMGQGKKPFLARFCELPGNAAKAMAGDAQAGAGGAAVSPAPGAVPASFTDRVFRANSVLLHDINGFEDELVDDSLLTRNLVPPVQGVLTGAFGAGNEKAYVGRGGWLFYRPDVDYATGPGFLSTKRLVARARSGSEWVAAPQPDPVIAILQFRKQLAERGIELIVVPAPTKISVAPERFSSRYAQEKLPVQNPSYGELLRELADPAVFFARYEEFLAPYANVPADKALKSWHRPFREALAELAPARELLEKNPPLVFDPAALLVEEKYRTGRPQYLETDTHWRPEAMELVAAQLKEFIAKHVELPERTPAGYKRERVGVANLGDIAVMMKLPEGQTLYPKQEASVAQVSRDTEPWRPDPTADVLLLGDSFTNIYSVKDMNWGESAGFAEQLSCELGRPLDVITRNDAGAFATREMLSQELARGRDRLAGKKLVIWEFAARELSSGDWRVKSTPMALGKARESSLLAVAPGEKRLVTGVVREASAAPRPGTVTYQDHVIYAHLADLEAADGKPLAASEALVAIYSMRKQVWTDAARWRPGQSVTLELSNLDEADQRLKVRTVKSSLLEGDLALEDPCWAEEPAGAGAGAGASGAEMAAAEEPFGGFGWPELAGALGVVLALAGVLRFSEGLERRHAREDAARAAAEKGAASAGSEEEKRS